MEGIHHEGEAAVARRDIGRFKTLMRAEDVMYLDTRQEA